MFYLFIYLKRIRYVIAVCSVTLGEKNENSRKQWTFNDAFRSDSDFCFGFFSLPAGVTAGQ